jgi:hypothetical protein
MRTVAGRLKSDYRYSNTIVYNNYPFPKAIKPAIKTKIATAAQAILEARLVEQNRCEQNGQKYSLATLYAANNMPEDLLKAHNLLDKTVDLAYGYKGAKDDAARVAFLFIQYQELIAPLLDAEQVKKPKKSTIKNSESSQ